MKPSVLLPTTPLTRLARHVGPPPFLRAVSAPAARRAPARAREAWRRPDHVTRVDLVDPLEEAQPQGINGMEQ